MINEKTIIPGGKGSAGFAIKSNYPEKDGILARLLAAAPVAARVAGLRGKGEGPPRAYAFCSYSALESLTDLEVLLEQGRKYFLG
jgi:hypothetical protein